MAAAITDISGDVAVTVLGALLVALLTAVTTNRRQDHQLAHERVEADRAELRQTLDAAAAAAIDAFRKAAHASESIRPEHFETPHAEERSYLSLLASDAIRGVTKAVTELTPHLGRLQFRLGADHPTVRLYAELTDVGNRLDDALPDEASFTSAAAATSRAVTREFTSKMGEFIDSAHAVVGTSAPALEPPSDEW